MSRVTSKKDLKMLITDEKEDMDETENVVYKEVFRITRMSHICKLLCHIYDPCECTGMVSSVESVDKNAQQIESFRRLDHQK